jgi:gliding motility-associated peptidyl-prolyl isomerase
MKKFSFLLILLLGFSCEEPQPRRPVKVSSGTFIKESAERNKKLLAREEALIRQRIQMDSLREYTHTAEGSWYAYDLRNEVTDYRPQTDDLVRFTYALLTLENDTIYSGNDIGLQTYKVDKQELFPGMRNSIKLLKEGETATFFYPSSLGYGYLGDKNKIGVNVPLKAVITIIEIEPANQENTP